MRVLILCCFIACFGSRSAAQCELETLDPIPGGSAFGTTVTSDSGVIAVGDPQGAAGGIVQLFAWSNLSGAALPPIVPTDGSSVGSAFGAALSLHDGILLIGAPNHAGSNAASPGRGALYLADPLTTTVEVVEAPPNSGTGDQLGSAVAWGNGYWAAGAPGASNNAGSVSVYSGSGEEWTWQQSVGATDPQPWAQFGASVALQGETLVVGAPGADSFRGAIYVFEWQGGSWIQVAKLTASDAQPGDRIGESLTLRASGSQLEILSGAPGFDLVGFQDAGRVISFRRSESNLWNQEAIFHPEPEVDAEFGASLGLENELLLVGSPGQENYEGAGFLFARNRSLSPTWTHLSTINATGGDYSEGGASVSLADGIAWLGSRLAPGGGSVQGWLVDDRDCDGNGLLDGCDILEGTAADLNGNGVPDSCERFIRGDCDRSGSIGLTDVVTLLESLFIIPTTPLQCPAAGDANEDGIVQIADAIRLLLVLFVPSSPPLAAPWPECGIEDEANLACDAETACP